MQIGGYIIEDEEPNKVRIREAGSLIPGIVVPLWLFEDWLYEFLTKEKEHEDQRNPHRSQ